MPFLTANSFKECLHDSLRRLSRSQSYRNYAGAFFDRQTKEVGGLSPKASPRTTPDFSLPIVKTNPGGVVVPVGACISVVGTVRVKGNVTGRYYDFSRATPDQPVDARDAEALLGTCFFRRNL